MRASAPAPAAADNCARAASRAVGVRRSLVGTSSSACGLAAPMRRVIRRRLPRSLANLNYGADQVALFAPQLEQAAAVRLAHGVARRAHVEEHTAVLKHSGGGVLSKVVVDCAGKLRGGDGGVEPGPSVAPTSPCRARRLVMCAVWWRECHVVDGERGGESLAAVLGMVEATLKVVLASWIRAARPSACAARRSMPATPSSGACAVGELRPCSFVVGLDGGPILSERELEADIGVRVAVGDVMHDLAHGPAAVAIGRVELGVGEAVNCGAQMRRAVGAGSGSARRGLSGGFSRLAVKRPMG